MHVKDERQKMCLNACVEKQRKETMLACLYSRMLTFMYKVWQNTKAYWRRYV